MTERKKYIYTILIFLVIFFLYILNFENVKFLFRSDNNIVKAQSGNQFIKLEVYPSANYNDLGNSVEVGIRNARDWDNNFETFYDVPPTTTVLNNSFYKLTIPATTGINLVFNRIKPEPINFLFNNKTCDSLGGTINGSNCIIYGMFTKTTSSQEEIWKISARTNNSSFGNIYFYIVSSSDALNPQLGQDNYYLIPTSTTVNLNNDNPSSTITYSVYYKKLYCYSGLSAASPTIIPPSSGFILSGFSNIQPSNFSSGNIFVNRNLVLDRVASGNYELILKKDGATDNVSNPSIIRVNNQITPPPLVISCNATPTSVEIGSSTDYTLTASSTNILGNTTITLDIISQDGSDYNRYIWFFRNLNSNSTTLATSVTWTNTGTYFATATVQALGISSSNSCPVVNVGSCNCLYRPAAGQYERRCRDSNGNWSGWEPYSGSIERNCNCGNQEVFRRYGECQTD
ncbi:MAG: hypothetical protein KatS3mg095_0035 [Candidatus Parcubacteria bacterium]|nr:MAG: hypothetical protein KatS3mg095_0035 [Candidatus Parcubacteria bacterium]